MTYIDKETCVALRSELYEKGDSPRKVLTVDRSKLAKEGDVFLGREQLMKDFRDETETLLVIEEVEVGAGIPRKMFSQRELEAGGH